MALDPLPPLWKLMVMSLGLQQAVYWISWALGQTYAGWRSLVWILGSVTIGSATVFRKGERPLETVMVFDAKSNSYHEKPVSALTDSELEWHERAEANAMGEAGIYATVIGFYTDRGPFESARDAVIHRRRLAAILGERKSRRVKR